MCTKVFRKAFPSLIDENLLEYQRGITEPCLSTADVVWVSKKCFEADSYREVKTAADNSSLQQNSPVHNLKPPQTDLQSVKLQTEFQLRNPLSEVSRWHFLSVKMRALPKPCNRRPL